MYPFKKFTITCPYGKKGSWQCGYHTGTDLVGTDDNVMAVAAGTVTTVSFSKSYGNNVVIHHDDDTASRYAHLALAKVKTGDKVSEGQTVGIQGSTGNSTGKHLHLEIFKKLPVVYPSVFPGNTMNPVEYLDAHSKKYTEYLCRQVLPLDLGVAIVDQQAWNIGIANFMTGGFFGKEAGGRTYPAVHLLDSGKLLEKMPGTQFTQPTLYTTFDGKIGIIMTNDPSSVPKVKSAISGIAVCGDLDYDYMKQGWDNSWNYDTVHALLGIKGGLVYCCMVKGGYADLKSYAADKRFEKAIKLDGGGSAVCRDGNKLLYKCPTENRRINSIVMWDK
ncbi:MAG: M23 family metallopeptidase [Bacillota bacterium]|nr:M23 family metallopeptidase [Bacillota bacterium]